MTRGVFAFILCALVGVYGTDRFICQDAQRCVWQYVGRLQIPAPPTPSYRAIIINKEPFLAEGANGLDKLCQFQAEFKTCMAEDLQCLDGNSFQLLAKALSINDAEGQLYEMMFAENDYECGDGRTDLLDNLNCFKNHRNQSLEIMANCRSAFSTHFTPGSSNRCALAATLTECLRDGFRNQCGKEAGEFMCNEEKVALSKSNYADCSSQISAVDCKGAHKILGTTSLILLIATAFLQLFN